MLRSIFSQAGGFLIGRTIIQVIYHSDPQPHHLEREIERRTTSIQPAWLMRTGWCSCLGLLQQGKLMRMYITRALLTGFDVQCQLSGSAVAADWHAVFRHGISPALLMMTVAADKHCTPTDIIVSSSCRHQTQTPTERRGCSSVRTACAHFDPAWSCHGLSL